MLYDCVMFCHKLLQILEKKNGKNLRPQLYLAEVTVPLIEMRIDLYLPLNNTYH